MKRGTLITVVGSALILALALTGCGGGGGASSNQLHVYNWSTYIDPQILVDFQDQFDATVTYDEFGGNDELYARIQPGNPGYDIIVPTDYMVEVMIDEGLVEELDHDAIPNLVNLDPLFADPPYDPGLVHCVPYQWGTLAIGYNIARVGREIDSWEVFFSHEFAGRIAFQDSSRETMAVALLYLGYDPNTTNPDEIAEARDLMLSVKDDIVAFVPDTGQELLEAGEVDIVMEYSGDIFQLMTDNPDIRYVIPREGAQLWTDNMCIPTGAPNPDLAHQFINFILDGEVGAQLSTYTLYGTPNAASFALLDEALATDPAIYPPDEVKQHLFFIRSLGDADSLYDEAWTAIGVGQ